MPQTIKREKPVFAIISGACFALYIFLNSLAPIIQYISIRRYMPQLSFGIYFANSLLSIALSLTPCFLVMLAVLIRKSPVFTGVSFILFAIVPMLIVALSYLSSGYSHYAEIIFRIIPFSSSFPEVLSKITICAIALCLVLPGACAKIAAAILCFTVKRSPGKTGKIWLLPVVFLAVGKVVDFGKGIVSIIEFRNIYISKLDVITLIKLYFTNFSRFAGNYLIDIIGNWLIIAGILLFCLWIKSVADKATVAAATPAVSQTVILPNPKFEPSGAGNPPQSFSAQSKNPAQPTSETAVTLNPDFVAPKPPYTSAPPKAPYRVTYVPEANTDDNMSFDEKLTRLKKLLDDGVITEEEFAAKKKQILEL